jgi:hypothetical protein
MTCEQLYSLHTIRADWSQDHEVLKLALIFTKKNHLILATCP